jgi:hypothetical protein
MKKIAIVFCLILLVGCEKPGDCVKSSGPMRSRVYENLVFSKILVNKGIGVVISEGTDYKVEVKAGENLINDIEVELVGDMLKLTDNTTCNWTREYGETVVYITAPNLTDIYSKTEKTIASGGILHFPALRLVSMDTFDGYDGVGTGDFILQLEIEGRLTVESNDISGFFLIGHANSMFVNFYESGGILHGEKLYAQDIEVYHRGTNNVILYPIHSINGGIYNSGNVICYNHPELPEQVGEYYRGKLIFIQ